MELTNSKRHLLTASYVEKHLTEADQQRTDRQPGGGIQKANLLRALNLNTEDLSRLIEQIHREDSDSSKYLVELVRIVRNFAAEGHKYSNMYLASVLADIPSGALVRFAELSRPLEESNDMHVIIDALVRRRRIAPVGELHLERLEIYPVGEERGELTFTVPLSPSESVTISHKEWSTSSQEFDEIVQDFFESYSERGVAEKTDSSMSSENESRHVNTLNFGASASYSQFGTVSITTSLGLTNTNEERKSVKESMQKNRDVTEKASARARKEHKVSIKLETKKGVEDSSFRTITNPHTDKALRIDYYRFMRKWRTDLFRYGVRMTYDITIPTPGARLFARYKQIANLEAELRIPFVFTLKPSDLTDANWQSKADDYGVTLEKPADPTIPLTITKTLTSDKGGNETFTFEPPEGYLLDMDIKGEAMWHGPEPDFPPFMFPPNTLVNSTSPVGTLGGGGSFKLTGRAFGSSRQATFNVIFAKTTIFLTLTMGAKRMSGVYAAWQMASWKIIRDAAEAQYNEKLARLQAERDRLWIEISGRDTLSLRRLEREELVRCIMLWLVGPSFPLSTNSVADCMKTVFKNELDFLVNGSSHISPTMKGVTDFNSLGVLSFGEFVKFIHQAVEWENLLYFLFPYFWGSEEIGRDKIFFEHQDPEHQNFLRAGYARVVLTIRPGFENDFMRLVETGKISGEYTSPYISIPEMIHFKALTNYSGIPPANPEKHARPLLYPQQRETWKTMEQVIQALESVKTTTGSYPPDLTSLPGAPFKDAWGNELIYKLPGSGNEYDLISYGADGMEGGEDVNADISAAAGASLIASWFDYTPTSGLDIDVKTVPI